MCVCVFRAHTNSQPDRDRQRQLGCQVWATGQHYRGCCSFPFLSFIWHSPFPASRHLLAYRQWVKVVAIASVVGTAVIVLIAAIIICRRHCSRRRRRRRSISSSPSINDDHLRLVFDKGVERCLSRMQHRAQAEVDLLRRLLHCTGGTVCRLQDQECLGKN